MSSRSTMIKVNECYSFKCGMPWKGSDYDHYIAEQK